jgi:acyl carrier protein
MSDEVLIAAITGNARTVFKQPQLVYRPDLVFRDILGFDSVLAVQFILAMEAALGVTLVDEEVDRMHTMGDLLGVLRTKPAAIQAA